MHGDHDNSREQQRQQRRIAITDTMDARTEHHGIHFRRLQHEPVQEHSGQIACYNKSAKENAEGGGLSVATSQNVLTFRGN